MDLSNSKIDIWQKCKYLFHYKYIQHKELPPTSKQILGNLVHSVLENAVNLKYDSRGQLLADFRKQYAESKLKGDKLLREGEQILYQFPLQELRQKNILHAEYEFHVPVTSDINLVGIMDRIDIHDDNTIIITDYKTSMEVDLKHYGLQMQIYNYAASKKFPQYKNRKLDWYFVRYNSHNTLSLKDESFDNIVSVCQRTAEGISAETKWPKNVSSECKWCTILGECNAR